jgi:hypothetical protein
MPDSDKFSMSNRTFHVFISYAQPDKTVADAVRATLEAHHFRCWISPRDVPPGIEFPEAIIEGIERSKVLVLIFSSHSNNSPHVIRELTNAVNKGVVLVPFRIEDIQPSKSMEYLISVPHWLDAVNPPLEKHIEDLARVVGNIVLSQKDATTCVSCGTYLSLEAKFCENCGATVSKGLSTPPKSETSTPPQKITKPLPELKTSQVAVTRSRFNLFGKKRVLIGAGIVIIVLVLVGIIIPPVLTLFQIPISIYKGVETVTPTSAVNYRSSNTPINTVTFTVGTTQSLPIETQLFVVANKDPITVMVNIIFEGGPGLGLVQNNSVILSRSDGTVTTGKLDFNQKGSEISLQGSRGTDRLQVLVTMDSGKTYVIIDELVPYPR